MPLVRKKLDDAKPPADDEPEVAVRLQSPDAEDRWEAARQLAGFSEAIPELTQLLGHEHDERVREAAFTSLAKMNSGESFDAILRYLRVDDASFRTAALDALKLMPELAGRRLDALLHDRDADVRVLACDLARVVPPAIAQTSLGAILAGEPEINVCAAAIDLLAEIGTPEILPGLAICSQRFSAPFLDFSIQAAKRQIRARSAPPQA